MDYSISTRNIVIVGSFNPANFDKYFFINNNIIKENEILDNSFFNVDFVQLQSVKFELLILFNQLIITSKTPLESDVIDSIVVKLIELSSIKFSALGINFHWDLKTENLQKTSRLMFYNSNNKMIEKHFNTEDSSYGFYVSRSYKESRLKLDVKPSIINNTESKSIKSVINFAFNFHHDLKSEDGKDKILEYLKLYPDYQNQSQLMMNSYA